VKGATITIGGPPGSGKTTAARRLAEILNREYRSAGEVFRAEAQARGLDLLTFGQLAEKDPTIDHALDGAMVALAGPRRLLEGRIIGELLARRNLPVYRILVTADERTRAQRIARREHLTYEQVLPAMRAREASERVRYGRYYGMDPDELHYELVLDTSSLAPEQVVQTILDRLPEDLKEAEG
jgi:cytidylate kinase